MSSSLLFRRPERRWRVPSAIRASPESMGGHHRKPLETSPAGPHGPKSKGLPFQNATIMKPMNPAYIYTLDEGLGLKVAPKTIHLAYIYIWFAGPQALPASTGTTTCLGKHTYIYAKLPFFDPSSLRRWRFRAGGVTKNTFLLILFGPLLFSIRPSFSQ